MVLWAAHPRKDPNATFPPLNSTIRKMLLQVKYQLILQDLALQIPRSELNKRSSLILTELTWPTLRAVITVPRPTAIIGTAT